MISAAIPSQANGPLFLMHIHSRRAVLGVFQASRVPDRSESALPGAAEEQHSGEAAPPPTLEVSTAASRHVVQSRGRVTWRNHVHVSFSGVTCLAQSR